MGFVSGNWKFPIVIVAIVFLAGLLIASTKNQKTETQQSKVLSESKEVNMTDTNVTSAPEPTGIQAETQPPMQIDKAKKYTAILKTTEGDITISLNAQDTPVTVNNFVYLARKNFYNNTVFHRVIKGFMIQGGDPKGDGTGGPGYKFDDESFKGNYTRGTVAMANAGPNTNGSQFFIMHQDNPLPKNYVIFGQVSSGLEIVDKIAEAQVKANPMSGENSTPISPVTVDNVVIVEK